MGAGGGGFLVAITRSAHAHAEVAQVLRAAPLERVAQAAATTDDDKDDDDGDRWSVHRVTVDDVGLALTTEAATTFLYTI